MCRHPPAAACSASLRTWNWNFDPWTPLDTLGRIIHGLHETGDCQAYALAVSASCRAIMVSASLAEGSEYPQDSKISWSGSGVASDSKRGLKNGSDGGGGKGAQPLQRPQSALACGVCCSGTGVSIGQPPAETGDRRRLAVFGSAWDHPGRSVADGVTAGTGSTAPGPLPSSASEESGVSRRRWCWSVLGECIR